MAAHAATTSYGIWSDSVVPKNPADQDTSKLNVGVKFSSNVDGYVNAVQFYRSSANAGPHTGQLWTAQGTLLSQVSFPSTTATGWLTANFSSPVKLAAGKSYIASYIAPRGRYAHDTGVLSPTKPAVNGALKATQGVYTYGSGVPSQTRRSSNYYVDVVFTPGSDPTPTPTQTPTPTPSGTAPGLQCAAPNVITEGGGGTYGAGYYIHNNNWSDTYGGSHVIQACAEDDWVVDVNVPAHSDMAVEAYPNVHMDYNNVPVSNIASADFGALAPDCVGCVYNVAFDIWIGSGLTNELMIWTQNHGQRPAGTRLADQVIGGHNYQVWHNAGYTAYVADPALPAGNMPLALFFQDMQARGWALSSATTWQVGYGVETVTTGGVNQRFDFTDFSVNTTP